MTAPRKSRLHPVTKFVIGLTIGVAAVWLVISTAGGLGDAVAAMGRMRGGLVALAFGFATLRMLLSDCNRSGSDVEPGR